MVQAAKHGLHHGAGMWQTSKNEFSLKSATCLHQADGGLSLILST